MEIPKTLQVNTIDGKSFGIPVHIGADLEAVAGRLEVVVSPTVKDLVAGSRATFQTAVSTS